MDDVTPAIAQRPQRFRGTLLRAVLGLTAGALLVVAFLRLVDVGSVLNRLEHLNIWLALVCGALFLGAYVVRALRWRVLLSPDRPSILRVIAIYQVATFVNWLLPVRGGELVKCLLLRRSDRIPVSRSLATVGVDKGMDLLPAVVLLALLPFVDLHLSRALWVLLLMTLIVVALAVALVAVAASRPDHALTVIARLLTRLLPRRMSARVEPFVAHFLATVVDLAHRPRVLLLACGYTAVAVAFDASFCLVAFRAVGVPVAVPVVLYGYTFYNLAFILPTPPGQVGSNELVGLLIFSGVFRMGRSDVGAMFLFSHPWTAILMSVTGLSCLSAMGLTLRSTLRLTEHQPEWEQA